MAESSVLRCDGERSLPAKSNQPGLACTPALRLAVTAGMRFGPRAVVRGNERRSLWNPLPPARQGPAQAPAVQVRVATITAFAAPLVGQRVKVVDGVVGRIVSSRFFVLANGGPNVPLGGSRTVAVVLESGRAMLSPGQRVVVTGVVRAHLLSKRKSGAGSSVH